MMIRLNVTGAYEGATKVEVWIDKLLPELRDTMHETCLTIKDELERRANLEGYTEWAESLEGRTWIDEVGGIIYGSVGSTVDYAEVVERGDKAAYVDTHCPRQCYKESKLRERQEPTKQGLPILDRVAKEIIDQIRPVFVETIMSVIKREL